MSSDDLERKLDELIAAAVPLERSGYELVYRSLFTAILCKRDRVALGKQEDLLEAYAVPHRIPQGGHGDVVEIQGQTYVVLGPLLGEAKVRIEQREPPYVRPSRVPLSFAFFPNMANTHWTALTAGRGSSDKSNSKEVYGWQRPTGGIEAANLALRLQNTLEQSINRKSLQLLPTHAEFGYAPYSYGASDAKPATVYRADGLWVYKGSATYHFPALRDSKEISARSCRVIVLAHLKDRFEVWSTFAGNESDVCRQLVAYYRLMGEECRWIDVASIGGFHNPTTPYSKQNPGDYLVSATTQPGRIRTTVKLGDESVAIIIREHKYDTNQRLALQAVDASDGSPFGSVTVNLDYPLAEGEILVRTYSEHEWTKQLLTLLPDVFQDTGRTVPTGHVHANVWKYNRLPAGEPANG